MAKAKGGIYLQLHMFNACLYMQLHNSAKDLVDDTHMRVQKCNDWITRTCGAHSQSESMYMLRYFQEIGEMSEAFHFDKGKISLQVTILGSPFVYQIHRPQRASCPPVSSACPVARLRQKLQAEHCHFCQK